MSPSNHQIKIGLVQMRSEKGAIEANLDRISFYLQDGIRQGVDIMAFPEMSISGYINPLRMPEGIFSLDSPAVTRAIGITHGTHGTVLMGFIEANPQGNPFVTQIVAREGQLIGVYRKRTIPDDEKDWFAPGDSPGIVADLLVTFGIAVCADIDHQQVFADCAEQGARLVFLCAAPGLYGAQLTRDWRAGFTWWQTECSRKLGRYAEEYGIHIAVATQSGRTRDEDFPGGGYVFAPDGRCVEATPDWSEGILYASIPAC